MYDKNAMLIESGSNVTATVNGASKNVGPSLVPETYMIYVPQATGTSPTLDVSIEESDDGSTWNEKTSMPQITVAGTYYQTVMSSKRYRRAVLTVGGTTPNFGLVMVGRVPAGQYTKW